MDLFTSIVFAIEVLKLLIYEQTKHTSLQY